MTPDYYQLLQIEPHATTEEIHKAYRVLAMRYHPDRNSTPDAASRMVAINEAYFVLRDPTRRRRYDQERSRNEKPNIATPILRAAEETLLKQGWVVAKQDGTNIILELGTRAVHVSLVSRLDNLKLRKIEKKFGGFSVVMTVEIETPINPSFHTAVIDLMKSKHFGADFPDHTYKALFASFF